MIFPIFNDQRLTDPKHRLNESKLYVFIKDRSEQDQIKMLQYTPDELLEMIYASEQTRKDLPVFDHAFRHFQQVEYQMLKLAEHLDMRQSYLKLLE